MGSEKIASRILTQYRRRVGRNTLLRITEFSVQISAVKRTTLRLVK
jgi:hypothetical protein